MQPARRVCAASRHGTSALSLDKVVPVALKKGKPGTQAFRTALKDAIESYGGIPVTQGVVTHTKDDHFGFDKQGQMMLTVKNGEFVAAD